MKQVLINIWAYREMILSFMRLSIRITSEQTVMGAFWILAKSAGITFIFTLLFEQNLDLESEAGVPYPLFVFSGLVCWVLFQRGLTTGIASLVNHRHIFSHVPLPREGIIMGAIASSMLDFLVNLVACFIAIVIWGNGLSSALLCLPLLVGLQLLLILGVSVLCAPINVFLRDMGNFVPLALQFVLFLTPVLYPGKMVKPEWEPLMVTFNPIHRFVASYRTVLLDGQWPPASDFLVLAATACGVLIAGNLVFRRFDPILTDFV